MTDNRKWFMNDLDGTVHRISRAEYIYVELCSAASLLRVAHFAHKDHKNTVLDAAEINLRNARKALITIA